MISVNNIAVIDRPNAAPPPGDAAVCFPFDGSLMWQFAVCSLIAGVSERDGDRVIDLVM